MERIKSSVILVARHLINVAPSACLFSSSLGLALYSEAKDPMSIVIMVVQLTSLFVAAIVHHRELKAANLHKHVLTLVFGITIFALITQPVDALSRDLFHEWARSLFAIISMFTAVYIMGNPPSLPPKPLLEDGSPQAFGRLDDLYWPLPPPTIFSREYHARRIVQSSLDSLSNFGSSVFGHAGQEDPEYPRPPSHSGSELSLGTDTGREHESVTKARTICLSMEPILNLFKDKNQRH